MRKQRPALPESGEIVIDKPGNGAFHGTTLHARLRARGITPLLSARMTTDVFVQSSVLEANDRGYACLLVEEATASYSPSSSKPRWR